MFKKIVQSPHKRFLFYCFAFLSGITIASLVNTELPLPAWLFIGFLCCGGLIAGVSSKKGRVISTACVIILIGIVRYHLAQPFGGGHISNLSGRSVEITGYVAAEPDVRTDGIRYIIATTGEYTGKVYVKRDRHPAYQYGDLLQLYCKIERPEPIEDFRYDMYLARFGVFAICQQPSVRKIGEGEGNIMMQWILQVKDRVAQQINMLWHEPQASFMAGLLYGYRGGLGTLNEDFARTGTTHIIAISGYNISLISSILLTICIHLAIPRRKAIWLVLAGIAIFVIFAGLSASVVRAGIMGGLVLFASFLGKPSHIFSVMILTAVIMVVHNPFVLIWDAGFQLSFLSTVGLVYLSPFLERYGKWLPEAGGIRESFVATLSATLITLPLILSQFGRLSIVSLPVNMLILWIIPHIMAIGFFAVIISMMSLPIGTGISWIAWLGLQYIIIIVEWFSQLSFAAVDIGIPVWAMVGSYIAMILFFRTKGLQR